MEFGIVVVNVTGFIGRVRARLSLGGWWWWWISASCNGLGFRLRLRLGLWARVRDTAIAGGTFDSFLAPPLCLTPRIHEADREHLSEPLSEHLSEPLSKANAEPKYETKFAKPQHHPLHLALAFAQVIHLQDAVWAVSPTAG